jgi:beta-galactosidase
VVLDTTDPAQPIIRTEGILQGKGWKARYARELVILPGEIRVQYAVTRGDDYPLPRIGTRWHLPASPDSVQWTGRGPQENYPDRQEGALLGRYSLAAPDLYTPYLQPQENGNRGDVSSLTIRYGARPRVQVTGEPVFQFSLLPFTPESLDKARHPHELQRAPYEVLHVDHRMMGVGGDVSWLPAVHPPYLLTDKTWVARYRIRVVP